MLRKTKFNKKAVSLLICIISAFCLWIYVSYVENPDMTRWVSNIPVTVSGESRLNENGLAVKELSSTKVDMKLRAKRSMFKDLSADTIKATADVSSITQAGENILTVSVAFPSTTSGITIVDRNKMDIVVHVEKYVTQTFTIEPVILQNPTDGYYVKSVRMPEDEDMLLSVSGCESDIGRVHHISTSEVDLSKATDNVTLPLTFTAVDADSKVVEDVKLSLQNASVDFEIYKEVSIPLNVNVTQDNEELTYELTPSSIYVTGPAATVDNIEPITVANINESLYKADDTLTFNLTVPEGTTLRNGETDEVQIKFINVQ